MGVPCNRRPRPVFRIDRQGRLWRLTDDGWILLAGLFAYPLEEAA